MFSLFMGILYLRAGNVVKLLDAFNLKSIGTASATGISKRKETIKTNVVILIAATTSKLSGFVVHGLYSTGRRG